MAALALLIAFLTVVQLWQVPPPSTSLTAPAQTAKERGSTDAGATASGGGAKGAAASPSVVNLFDSNFSRTVLSGLGGLAAVSVATNFWREAGMHAEAYYFILFVAFFLIGLVATAVLRGFGEALRSRITLSRPAVLWPPLPPWLPLPKDDSSIPRIYRSWRWVRYWGRRVWSWVASFRATLLVFLDTTFNILVGRNQLQSAVFSETITDLHESLLEAAGRVRDEVHRAVIEALIRREALPKDLPHEERIRVGVSLLSEDESSVYYIAQELGSSPKRFSDHSLAWLAAFTGQARWMKLDSSGTPKEKAQWAPIYKDNLRAIAMDNRQSLLPRHSSAELPLKHFYEARSGEDYEAFLMLPMPWTNRGWAGEHRRGAIHISFKKASYMEALWENLETPAGPNYRKWGELLEAPERTFELEPGLARRAERLVVQSPTPKRRVLESLADTSRTVQDEYSGLLETVGELERQAASSEDASIVIKDAELCSVLHQALEVLGAALAHFDDDVYDIYVRARQHATMAAR